MSSDNSESMKKELLQRRVIFLRGDITPEKMDEICNQMIQLQASSPDRIDLLIDSGGGSTFAAFSLCNLMKTILTAPIRGIVVGNCSSAATFILLHCKERIGTPYSRFVIHSGTMGKISIQMNDSTSQNLENLLKEVKRTEEMVLELYMKHLTPPEWNEQTTPEEKRKFIKEIISRGDQPFDEWFATEEALKFGLIEKITEENLGIFT